MECVYIQNIRWRMPSRSQSRKWIDIVADIKNNYAGQNSVARSHGTAILHFYGFVPSSTKKQLI